jgi:hypothetical protein
LNCALLLGHDGKLYITPGMRARLRTSFPATAIRIVPRPSQDCRTGEGGGRQAVVLPEGL